MVMRTATTEFEYVVSSSPYACRSRSPGDSGVASFGASGNGCRNVGEHRNADKVRRRVKSFNLCWVS